MHSATPSLSSLGSPSSMPTYSLRLGRRWFAASRAQSPAAPAKERVAGGGKDSNAKEAAPKEASPAGEPVKVNYIRKLRSLLMHRVPPHFSRFKRNGEHRCRLKVLGRMVEAGGDSYEAAEQAAAKECFEELKTAARNRDKVPRAHYVKAQAPGPEAEWRVLAQKAGAQKAVKHPWDEAVPTLAHGLERLLHRDNSQAFAIADKVAGQPFSPYLKRIAQPDEIDWDQIAGFVPPSRDPALHALAVKHKRRFKASTSSFTGLIGHLYQILSNYRPVEVSKLSKEFGKMPRSLSATLRNKPVVSILTPHDQVWAIDSEPQLEHDNQILIDLGKTMERMLTMDQEEFSKLLLETPGGKGEED